MNIEQARQDILRWVTDFVEVANPALGGWAPCPYARAARVNNLLDIRAGGADPYVDLRGVADMSGRDVIALVYDPQLFSADEFNELIHSANPAFMAGRGMIALADHPQDREEVNGVVMNQGQYAIVFVQDLAKLNRFARQLADRGFYQGWPEHYLQTLFQGREDPRS